MIIIMCVFHDLKKLVNGMALLHSARNWTSLYARTFTKNSIVGRAMPSMLEMLEALLPPDLSCHPVSSKANIFDLLPKGCHTTDLSNFESFTEPGG